MMLMRVLSMCSIKVGGYSIDSCCAKGRGLIAKVHFFVQGAKNSHTISC